MSLSKHILICPLDWGLGHATRCVPIVSALVVRGCKVSMASSGAALALLKSEFPELPAYEITGYDPFYSSSNGMAWPMVKQLPKFMRTIRKEHFEIEQIIQRHSIDAVISDNRYGCWSATVPGVFLTHQLEIQAPRFLSPVIRYLNHQRIKRFGQCWVPDCIGANSLSGNLARSNGMPVTHIGPLSRFRKLEGVVPKYDIVAIASGPEPQRTIFEELVRSELKKNSTRALLVKGRPGDPKPTRDGSLEEVNHLHAMELNHVIQASKVVISRPGYSTIMDLSVLGSKAIFIPTPGQTEQEYLGGELMKQNIALCVNQRSFRLVSALEKSGSYSGFTAKAPNSALADALDTLFV